MLWMYDLGRRVESLLGTGKYIAFVLTAALVSNFAQYYFKHPNFGGMSGVVYALIGYAWVQYRYAGVMWLYLGPSGMFIAMIWLAMSMANPASNVANWRTAWGCSWARCWDGCRLRGGDGDSAKPQASCEACPSTPVLPN